MEFQTGPIAPSVEEMGLGRKMLPGFSSGYFIGYDILFWPGEINSLSNTSMQLYPSEAFYGSSV